MHHCDCFCLVLDNKRTALLADKEHILINDSKHNTSNQTREQFLDDVLAPLNKYTPAIDIPYLPIQIINTLEGRKKEEFLYLLDRFCCDYMNERKLAIVAPEPKYRSLETFLKEEKIRIYTPLVRKIIECITNIFNSKTKIDRLDSYVYDVFSNDYCHKFNGLKKLNPETEKELVDLLEDLRSLYSEYTKEVGEIDEILGIYYIDGAINIGFFDESLPPEDLFISICEKNNWKYEYEQYGYEQYERYFKIKL
jgi:hypothetical protein